MKYLPMLLLLVAVGCRSAKKEIADGARIVMARASTIEAEADAGEAEAEGLLKNKQLPESCKPVVRSMEKKFDRIGDEARDAREAAESIEGNLDGVQDKPMSWKWKAGLGLGAAGILWFVVAGFTNRSALGMLVGAFGFIFGRKKAD